MPNLNRQELEINILKKTTILVRFMLCTKPNCYLMSKLMKRCILNSILCMMTAWRIKYYSIAILVGFFLAVLFSVITARDGAIITGRLGGDFPAFYTAGKLVVQGESQSIYDSDRMLSEQKHIIPTGGYLPFVNPPHFAYFYAPFGALPYNFAFLVHYCLLVLLLICVLKRFISLNYIRAPMFFFSLVACMTFYPILKSILGGQNSILSFFLIFSVWKLADSGREWLAGLFLGLLLYKPQFAIPFIGLFFLAGYWRIAVSGVLTGTGIVLCTVFLLKHNLKEWLTFVFAFSELDADINKFNSISLSGFAEALSDSENGILLKLAGIGVILVMISISVLWFQGKKKRNLKELMAAACPAVLLIPPHVMYYDLSLCVLSVLLLVKHEEVRSKVAPILWLLGFTQWFSSLLGFSPLFLILVGMYIYFFRLSWQRSENASQSLRSCAVC